MGTKNMAVSAQQQQKRTAVNYFVAFAAMATLSLIPDIANAAAGTLSQPDVSSIVTYIKGLATGPAFEIGSAGLMLTVGIRGLKRIRGAF